MAQERIEALFVRLVPLDISDDGFRRDRCPALDHAGMKSTEIGEVPIETPPRDAEPAREHVRLQRIEALVREPRQAEIDPVLCRQALGHYAAPYSDVLTRVRTH